MSFDITDSYLHTEIGTVAVNAPLVGYRFGRPNPQYQGVSLSSNGDWITCNSHKPYRVPSEYRPWYSAVSGCTIGIIARSIRTEVQTLFSGVTLQKLTKCPFHLIDRHALLIILNVNNGRLELPSRNFAIEQNVAFTVRAVLELRKKEVGHHPADASGTSPDVTALACEVPSCRVEHLRG